MADQQDNHPDAMRQLLERVSRLEQFVEARSRPYIAIDLYPRGFVNALYMRIRNIGHSPAVNIEVKFDRPIKIRERITDQFSIFRGIPVMGPGDSISFFYDSAIELLQEGKDTAFSGRVSYHDTSGSQYENEFRFDVEMFRNLALVSEGQFEHDLKSEMEKLRRDVEEISQAFRDLRMKSLLAAWEEQKATDTSKQAQAESGQ